PLSYILLLRSSSVCLFSSSCLFLSFSSSLFFFIDSALTEIYTLSLHDALPISDFLGGIDDHDLGVGIWCARDGDGCCVPAWAHQDRKSTRLNSSHVSISYAVFCLKKKKNERKESHTSDQQSPVHIDCRAPLTTN